MRRILQEKWEYIKECPQYLVSNYGEVVNSRTGRETKASENQRGISQVTLAQNGRVFNRSLAVLVARAFVPKDRELFDSVINLDGIRANCRADNLAWRPRWFTIAYHKQFNFESYQKMSPRLRLTNTGETYLGFKKVVPQYGLYYFDVLRSAEAGEYVFPHRFLFKFDV